MPYHLRSWRVAVITAVVAIGCRPQPPPPPPPHRPPPAVDVAALARATLDAGTPVDAAGGPVVDADTTTPSPTCAAALARWSDADALGPYVERVDRETVAAIAELSAKATTCSDDQRVLALAASMARLEDHRVIADRSPTDGPIVQARHGAIAILEGLSGYAFGSFHVEYPIMYESQRPNAADTTLRALDERIALRGWRAWWAQIKGAPGEAIALGRRAAAGAAIPPFVFADAKIQAELQALLAARAKLVASIRDSP